MRGVITIIISLSSKALLMLSECCQGPGFRDPQDAIMNGQRETLLYVPCIYRHKGEPDYLATIDINRNSCNYCQVNRHDNLVTIDIYRDTRNYCQVNTHDYLVTIDIYRDSSSYCQVNKCVRLTVYVISSLNHNFSTSLLYTGNCFVMLLRLHLGDSTGI